VPIARAKENSRLGPAVQPNLDQPLKLEASTLALTAVAMTVNLGFLTVVRETNGYLGGYLVTNQWGRPLEFRLSTAVQPNRVQQILYGETLEPYLYAEVIGKTLLEKAGVAAHLIVTDRRPVLEIRPRLEMPVLFLAEESEELGCFRPAAEGQSRFCRHPNFPTDEAAIRLLLQRLESPFDLLEPFCRVREAMSEARKMGVTDRG
jgi:hypothetical protein